MLQRCRLGRLWTLILVGGLSWLAVGCSPQMLTMLLMPFQDNKKDPEYKLFADSKEVKLVVMSRWENSDFFRPELVAADPELADAVSDFLRKRCQDNKQTLKLVPQIDVRNYQQRLRSEGTLSPVDVGKKFKADYVLDLNIKKFDIYQRDSVPRMFKGTAQIDVKLYKVNPKTDDPAEVFKAPYHAEYTGNRGVPLEVSNNDPAVYRQAFLRKVGREISRLFVEYDPEEIKSSAAFD